MSYTLRVICQKNSLLSPEDVTSFITDGVYFESTPQFSITERNNQEGSWALMVQYQDDKRPITITRNQEDRLFYAEQQELLSEHLESVSEVKIKAKLTDHISKAIQIIAIEIGSDLPEEAWQMIDSLEAYVARELNGIIYAPNDGFYDKKLRVLSKI